MDEIMCKKPAFTLTVGELVEVIKEELLQDVKPQPARVNEPVKYLYSIRELADFIGCSVVTAQKIKNSGRIRYKQIGRKVIFNTNEILEDMAANKKTARYGKS